MGQGAISQTLTNAIIHNKVAHAYLFTGPRGTGKTSAARILAKSLNCETGPTSEPCGVCSGCKDITSGNALDVIEIDAASNRSVEDARDLIDRVQFAPVAGRYKVYIIDEVHMLTPQAFNTLLKTLEEPPPNLVFILATTEVHKVLETIVSRCQRFDFRRISQDIMVKRLGDISEKENIKISPEALNLIARRSAGGLRDALGLLDQISVLSNVGQEIGVKDVLSLIGALPEDMLIKISEGISNKDGAYVLKVLNELMALGSEPLQIVKELTIHFRNLLIAATVKENLKDVIDASEEFFDDLKKIAKCFKQVEIAQIIDKLAYTERMVRNSTQPSLWLEVGILSICYRHEIFIIEELQKRIEELERIVTTGTVPPELTLSYEPEITTKQHKPMPVVTKPVERKIEHVQESTDLAEESFIPKALDTVKKTPSVEKEVKEVIIEPEIKIIEKQEEKKTLKTVATSSMDATWQAVINAVSNPPMKGMLNSLAVPLALTPEEVVIAFSQDIFINQMKETNKRKSLDDALNKVFGKVPIVTFKLISDQEHQASQKKNSKQESPTEKKIVDAPVIQGVMTQPSTEKEELKLEGSSDSSSTDVSNVVSDQYEVMLSEQAEIVKDIFQGKILNQ